MSSKRYRLKLATWIVVREAGEPSPRTTIILKMLHAWLWNLSVPATTTKNISGL
jgi:hypothetical protein